MTAPAFDLLPDGRVALSADTYLELIETAAYFDALHAGGVDSWDWYSDSVEEADLTEYEAAATIIHKRKETT